MSSLIAVPFLLSLLLIGLPLLQYFSELCAKSFVLVHEVDAQNGVLIFTQ